MWTISIATQDNKQRKKGNTIMRKKAFKQSFIKLFWLALTDGGVFENPKLWI
tara:strand:- start:121 stop:276 length:156 start_codon:yes stop_codon:yes gene_type:complete